MRHYISLIFLSITIACCAGTNNTDFHNGVNAFKKKEYSQAESHFNKEIEKNPSNVSAYFNLGLVHNAQKDYGKAIWAFERVLKLTPNNPEAIENIEQNYLELNNGQHWTPQLTHFERTTYGWSSNFWAFISVSLSVVIALLIIFFRKTSSLSRKRVFLVGSILTLVLMLFSIYTASEAHHYANTHDYAIVTKTEIETFKDNKPTNTDGTKNQLKTGTKVQRLEVYKGSRIKVKAMNGQTYFVNADDIDFI